MLPEKANPNPLGGSTAIESWQMRQFESRNLIPAPSTSKPHRDKSIAANGGEHIAVLVRFSPLHPYQRSQKLQLALYAATADVVLRVFLPVRQS